MKHLILFSFLLSLISCVEKSGPPSNEGIEILFKTNRLVFIELRDRIHQDLGVKQIMQVGVNLNREAEVSDKKMAEYIQELEKISTQRLTAYRAEPSNIQTSFLLASSGFVFGGCSSSIVHHQKGKPFIRDWAEPYKLIDLNEGWYAHTLCN